MCRDLCVVSDISHIAPVDTGCGLWEGATGTGKGMGR